MEFKASDEYWTMIRAYDRLKKISTDNGNSISNTDARDAVRDFLTLCYHFKDWLKKDTSLTLTTNVEKYISASEALALAADYCNAHKHAGLDGETRSGKQLEKINTHIRMDLTPRGFVTSSTLELTISGQKYDAFTLATKCLAEWEIYLAQNDIVFPQP